MMLAHVPIVYAGFGFPWGLLILGGILYLLWRNGMFGGPGRYGGWRNGGYGPGYGPGPGQGGPGQGGPGFRGPREYFDEWHRQAHEAAAQAQQPASPAAPAAPAAPAGEAPAAGNNEPAR
jgi:hypothetical protein